MTPNPRCAHLQPGTTAYGTRQVAGETWAVCANCFRAVGHVNGFINGLVQVHGIKETR